MYVVSGGVSLAFFFFFLSFLGSALLPHPVRPSAGGRRGPVPAGPEGLVVRALRRRLDRAPNGAAPGQGAHPARGRQGRHADVRAPPGGDRTDEEAGRGNPGDGVRARVGQQRRGALRAAGGEEEAVGRAVTGKGEKRRRTEKQLSPPGDEERKKKEGRNF